MTDSKKLVKLLIKLPTVQRNKVIDRLSENAQLMILQEIDLATAGGAMKAGAGLGAVVGAGSAAVSWLRNRRKLSQQLKACDTAECRKEVRREMAELRNEAIKQGLTRTVGGAAVGAGVGALGKYASTTPAGARVVSEIPPSAKVGAQKLADAGAATVGKVAQDAKVGVRRFRQGVQAGVDAAKKPPEIAQTNTQGTDVAQVPQEFQGLTPEQQQAAMTQIQQQQQQQQQQGQAETGQPNIVGRQAAASGETPAQQYRNRIAADQAAQTVAFRARRQ
jgi:hypothetical protein